MASTIAGRLLNRIVLFADIFGGTARCTLSKLDVHL